MIMHEVKLLLCVMAVSEEWRLCVWESDWALKQGLVDFWHLVFAYVGSYVY